MLLLPGSSACSATRPTGAWSYPRPIERSGRGTLGPGRPGLRTAFTGRDGATYFFFDDAVHPLPRTAPSARARPIRDRWGRSRNNFLAADGAGRRRVRRRGGTHLPVLRRPVRPLHRPRLPLHRPRLPEADRRQPAPRGAVREPAGGVRGRGRRPAAAGAGGRRGGGQRPHRLPVRRRRLPRGRRSAADRHLRPRRPRPGPQHRRRRGQGRRGAGHRRAHVYLFSGDQYVRYSGAALDVVDDGYPRDARRRRSPSELGLPALPDGVRDGIDAAFRAPDGRTTCSRERSSCASAGRAAPIAGPWGTVRNAFAADGRRRRRRVRRRPTGELYAFRGGQYVRYRPGDVRRRRGGLPPHGPGRLGRPAGRLRGRPSTARSSSRAAPT